VIKRNIVREDGKFYPWWDNLVSYINDAYRPSGSQLFMEYRDQLLAQYQGRYCVAGATDEPDFRRYVEFPDERYWMLFLLRWS
jgi:GMP synthase-like glutamine amidotransferase